MFKLVYIIITVAKQILLYELELCLDGSSWEIHVQCIIYTSCNIHELEKSHLMLFYIILMKIYVHVFTYSVGSRNFKEGKEKNGGLVR